MIHTKDVIKNKWWIASFLTVVIVVIIIPTLILLKGVDSNTEIPQGKHIKVGNRIFFNFLDHVRQNDDVLILGTSETGRALDGQNFWGLLDGDSTLDQRFHHLGGAGRCSYVYFPLIIENPKAFKGLNVILYVNPTYWRKGLNTFRADYYSRYVDKSLIASVKSEAKEFGIYQEFMEPIGPVVSLPVNGYGLIDNFRSLYYSDLDKILNPITTPEFDKNGFVDSSGLALVQKAMVKKLNMKYNVTEEYLEIGSSFTVVDTKSEFQSHMLEAFIKLVKENDINCLFYVGPINEVFGQEKNPELLDDHFIVMDEIKNILESNGMKYLDGTDQGKIPGTFDDLQHISELGAYLTAMQIKEYYEKSK